MSLPSVDLVCDGGFGIGYGHIRRTLALAEELRNAGVEVRVLALSRQAELLIPQQPQYDGDAPVVVFDSPSGVDDCMIRARMAGRCVVALDWFGDFEPDVAIVIYPHQSVRARFRSYIGTEYQIIRNAIVAQPRNVEGEGVVVMLGGGDVMGQGHAAAKQLSEQGLLVTLIQGPLASGPKEVNGYKVLFNPPDLPILLASSAWMVTNAGGCMFESMYLGKATVALPQTEAEQALACFGLKHGALLGIGKGHLRPYLREEIRPVACAAAKLIDGKGAQRVAEIVGGLL